MLRHFEPVPDTDGDAHNEYAGMADSATMLELLSRSWDSTQGARWSCQAESCCSASFCVATSTAGETGGAGQGMHGGGTCVLTARTIGEPTDRDRPARRCSRGEVASMGAVDLMPTGFANMVLGLAYFALSCSLKTS